METWRGGRWRARFAAMSGGTKALIYVAVLAGVGVLALVMTDELRDRLGPVAAEILPWVAIGAFLLWIISAGVRSGMKKARDDSTREMRPKGYTGAKSLNMPEDKDKGRGFPMD